MSGCFFLKHGVYWYMAASSLDYTITQSRPTHSHLDEFHDKALYKSA